MRRWKLERGRRGIEKKSVTGQEKILLIDRGLDIPFVTALLEEGYEVITCESPQTAWGLVFPYRPHCIIVHLPDPSSTDMAVLQECRALAEGAPIILAISAPGHEAVMKALEEGATSFLRLPVRPGTIKKVLDGLEPKDWGNMK